MYLDFSGTFARSDLLVHAGIFTVVLSAVTVLLGLIVGVIGAAMRLSRSRLLSGIAAAYVEIIRNTPFLVQIFIFYFGLSSLGIHLSAPVSAVITMVINVGAYSSEIIRAGMDAVPAGQIEAAECLGLSRPRIYWHVIMQPAFEKVYPAITSQFILMMLMSSVASQISTEELTAVANNVQSETFLSLESYIVVAMLYLILAVLLRFLFWLGGLWLFRRKRVIAAAERRMAMKQPSRPAAGRNNPLVRTGER